MPRPALVPSHSAPRNGHYVQLLDLSRHEAGETTTSSSSSRRRGTIPAGRIWGMSQRWMQKINSIDSAVNTANESSQFCKHSKQNASVRLVTSAKATRRQKVIRGMDKCLESVDFRASAQPAPSNSGHSALQPLTAPEKPTAVDLLCVSAISAGLRRAAVAPWHCSVLLLFLGELRWARS